MRKLEDGRMHATNLSLHVSIPWQSQFEYLAVFHIYFPVSRPAFEEKTQIDQEVAADNEL